MRKGNKSEYIAAVKNQLGDSWIEEYHFPHEENNVVMFVDAMAFIHKHQDKGCTTFSGMMHFVRDFDKGMSLRISG